MQSTQSMHGFNTLTPDRVLTLVEQALEVRLTNLCRPMNSYINRVYELAGKDGQALIAKFYRPGRWSPAALRDEHHFLLELADQEVPVIPPLVLGDGTTLGERDGFHFAVFPKKGGRYLDEYSDDQWVALGYLLGRMHLVGSAARPKDRRIMTPDRITAAQAAFLLEHGLLPNDLAERFRQLCGTLINECAPMFAGSALHRIHGDCHFGNIIHRAEEGFYLIDFDDMVVGPAVQDLWMLLPGTPDDCGWQIELFLEGYETFKPFDRGEFQLIEPLRAMRFIHYIAWCAYQVKEDGHSVVAPDFGSRAYWQQEIADLADQLARIQGADDRWSGRGY